MHTLIFAIASLNFLMYPLLNLSFEDARSCRLIKPCGLEDVCCIDPIIRSPSHDTVSVKLELIHGHLGVRMSAVVAFNTGNNPMTGRWKYSIIDILTLL